MPLFSALHAAEPEFSVIAPLASKSLLLGGVYTDGRAVVVGERGHILFSDDQGDTWIQARVPTIATLTGVYFHDKNLGWAVGHDAVILRTTDGGKNWERVHYAPEEERPLFDVWFKNEKIGIAVGAYGFFLTTKDGGTHWSAASISEDDWHLNQIIPSDTGKLYLAAEAGMVYRSDDEGQTWTNLPSPYEGSFFGTLPIGGDTVFIFGLRGNLYRSENAGKSWQRITTHTKSMLNSGLRLPDGRIFIVGQGGTVLVSNDDGKSFTLRHQPDRRGILSAFPIENNMLMLVGEGGVKKIPVSEKDK
ncbi:MAG: hypothetical protein HF970_10940 [ANME-2 cluster archaeon]|nr:hypothetical protein [ANME-2 cluster archaeon]